MKNLSKAERIRVLIVEAGPEMEMAIPHNIAVLVSAVRKAGYEVRIFSTNEYRLSGVTGDQARVKTLQVPPTSPTDVSPKPRETDMLSDFHKLLESYKPHIVGLSSTSEATYGPGLRLMAAIGDKDVFTIAGGVYPTLCPEDVISEHCIDAVCIGEGEEPLVELCNQMQHRKMDYTVKNIWFKTGSQVTKNPPGPLCDVNDVPGQDWMPWKIPPRASKAMAGEVRVTALVELTRGCPFSCNFCANHYLNHGFRGNYRERSVDRFIEEVQTLRTRFDLGFIYIVDETFLTTSQKRFKEFLEKYSSVALPFWCQSRPESVTYEKIKSLKNVGLQAINVGVESGNAEFRRMILNRASSDEKIVNGIRAAVQAGVRVGANVIIGFPGESREHVFETIELIREANPTSSMVHLFQPYKKTPLRDKCVEMGLIGEDHVCGDYRMEAIGTGNLTPEELFGLQRTFNLYTRFPKDRWSEIRRAEIFDPEGNTIFNNLASEYCLKVFGKTWVEDAGKIPISQIEARKSHTAFERQTLS